MSIASSSYSFIRYKFSSANCIDTIQCEGPSMPVWEVRDEIIAAKRLGRLIDCEIHLYDEQTKEEYLDDNYCIPRNSMVIVKRLPKSLSNNMSSNTGKFVKPRFQDGSGQYYFQSGSQQQQQQNLLQSQVIDRPVLSEGLSNVTPEILEEEAKIQAMSRATSEMFTKHLDMQESFALQSDKYSTKKIPQTAHQPSGRVPHPNYICYRCGSKGKIVLLDKDHYISDCTYGMIISADGKLQPMQMMRRVTGIPKTFLEQAKVTSAEETKKRMISYDGSMVYFTPNTREWNKFSSMAAKQGDLTFQEAENAE